MNIKDLWKDPRSRFEKREKNGRVCYSGCVWFDNVEFAFTLNEQSGGRYRGRVSAKDPKTGRVLQYEGKEKRELERQKRERRERKEQKRKEQEQKEQEPSDTLLVVLDVKIAGLAEGERQAKEIVLAKVKELYVKNKTRIRKQSLLAEETGNSTLMQGVTRHAESFFKTRRGNDKTIKTNSRQLEKAAMEFEKIPLKEIEVKKIRKLQKKNTLTDRQIGILRAFWDYYSENVMALPSNPFTQYRAEKRVKRTGAQVAKERATIRKLFENDEKKINEKLFNQAIQDGRYMALILAKDAGLNNTQMSKLQWKDIIFDNEEEDYVRICTEKVIAEHKKVFVRPCFSLCARALRQRYKKLHETETVKKLAKHYVVSEDGKEMQVQKLNSFIRETLACLGISNRVLAALHAETPQISAGVQLLLNTYKHKVEEMCALEEIDPAAIKFLQLLSFGRDTTANYYHDYMSEDGQWKLYVAMRRLDPFLKTNSREPCVKRSKPDGTNEKRTTSVSLESVTRYLQGKIEVELGPGEIIVIEGQYGVKGEARIMEAGQKSDKKIVYEEVSYFDLIQANP